MNYHEVKSGVNLKTLKTSCITFERFEKALRSFIPPKSETLFPLQYRIRLYRQRERLFTDLYVQKTIVVYRNVYFERLLSFPMLYEHRSQSLCCHGNRAR